MSEPRLTALNVLKHLWLIGLLVSFTINPAEAYIDPGTTGLLSQILYVLFYAALGVFLYCIQYIKRYLVSIKQVVRRVFAGRKQDQDSPKSR
jgi:hypothetical protein